MSPSRGTGAKTAERAPTTTRASPDAIRSRSSRRSASVRSRVQHGDAVAETRTEPAHGLRRERDLGDQHDRSSPALDRTRARLEVDLRLAGAGWPMQKEMATARPESGDDPVDRVALCRGESLRLRLAGERIASRWLVSLTASSPFSRSDQRECSSGCRPVVVGEPEGELHERSRNTIDDAAGVRDLDPGGSGDPELDNHASERSATEADRDHIAPLDLVGDLVGERAAESPRRDEGVDLCQRHDRRAYAPLRALLPLQGPPYTSCSTICRD